MIRSRLRVTASQLASRVDCAGIKARIADMWGGKRLFLDKLERDWLVLSFTNDPETLPSINSTAATTNGGFDPRDIHCGISRRGALVVYNAAAKGPTYQIEALFRDSSVSTPLATAPVSEGACTPVTAFFADAVGMRGLVSRNTLQICRS
jgi:hypothetical protein